MTVANAAAEATEKTSRHLRPVAVDPSARSCRSRRAFALAWYAVNILLLASFIATVYAAGWEYVTRRYLRGFSDAIIPASESSVGKVQAILDWMEHGPSRREPIPETLADADDRDPTDTLNYAALLQVCGTATNAFINLANTAGIPVRRLLLLDEHGVTVHVVAEVLIAGRWIVADPAFRTILRGPDGSLLTREDLIEPDTLAFAVRNIPEYLPSYTYDRAVHIRVARAGAVGLLLGRYLDGWAPGWEGSVTLSLLTERVSLAMLFISIPVVIFLLALRSGVRWYGQARLGIRPLLLRERVRRASIALLGTSSGEAA
jgi:hypothetical protein